MQTPSSSKSNGDQCVINVRDRPHNDEFLFRPESRLYHPPGGCDTEERKKAKIEANQLEEAPKTWKLFTSMNFEICIFLVLLVAILATSTVDDLKDARMLRLDSFNIMIFACVVVAGRLVSRLVISITIMVTMKLRGTHRAYFLLAVENPCKCLLWFIVVLVSWILVLTYNGGERSRNKDKTLGPLTKAIKCLVVVTTLWMLKILGMKSRAVSFTKARYFDKIKDVLFAQTFIRSLLVRHRDVRTIMGKGKMVVGEVQKYKGQKELCDQMPYDQWRKLNVYTVPASTLRLFTKITLYSSLDDELRQLQPGGLGQAIGGRTLCERTALLMADQIFDIVSKPGASFIDCIDLMKFMPKTLADDAMHNIEEALKNERMEGNQNSGRMEGTQNARKISRADLRQWLVTSLRDRRKLELALSNNHHVMKHANTVVGGIVLAFSLVCCTFILNDVKTVNFFTVLLTQSAILVLLCGDTAKTYLQSFQFFIRSRRFDVGDVCLIDGLWVIVQEIGLLETTFFTEQNLHLTLQNTTLLPLKSFTAIDKNVWTMKEE